MITIYIVLAILIFGLLITVHEFGHFLTAKLSGVRVNEFAIGMGPAILKKQKGETLYALRLFPIGGYCAMEGEDSDSDDPKAFGGKPVWKRILIVVAGSLMNLISGFLVLIIIFSTIAGIYVPTISSFEEGFPYSGEQGLLPGDQIIKIDGYYTIQYSDIQMMLNRNADRPRDITLLRDGQKVVLKDFTLEPREYLTDGEMKLRYGITFQQVPTELSFGDRLSVAFKSGSNMIKIVWMTLGDLLTGGVSTKDLTGPIGIATVISDTAKESMPNMWYLVAFISINLGVMNMLPLPALDGGRLIFLLIELVRRKPVNPKYENYVHLAGLAAFMLLMVYVAFNDVMRLIGK